MDSVSDQFVAYEKEIKTWRNDREESLRREDGWLTLAGLYWLHEGENTVGSDPSSDIVLPSRNIPESIGFIAFDNGKASLRVTCDEPVLVNGLPAVSAELRDDEAKDGPSLIRIRSVTFFVIKRVEQYGIRVRDANRPERHSFTGRIWFDINADYRLAASFVSHDPVRTLSVVNTLGLREPMDNPGYVAFSLHGQTFHLEAFGADDGGLWFIFKDATSGKSTYGAGRYLRATLTTDNSVELDFNKAYNPPCAFTKYATCPFAPKQNILPVAIEAGERV